MEGVTLPEKEAAATLEDLVDRSQRILSELLLASRSIKFAAEDARRIMDDLRQGQGTVGKLLTEDTTYDRIQTTLSSVDKVMTDIDDIGVSALVQSAYLPGSSSSLGTFNLGVSVGTRPFFVLGTTIRAAGPISGTHINAQFGYRFGPFALSTGLLESELGGAADFRLLPPLHLYAQLYRTQGIASPQLNAGLTYAFYRPFFAWLGGDYLNIGHIRSVTLGAGARFSLLGIK
jgi:hypothetical protein